MYRIQTDTAMTAILLVYQRLVYSPGEEDIKQEPLSNHQSNKPPCESKPLQVVLDKAGGWADPHCVRVISGVLKQAIVGIEDFPRQQEEEFTRWATVV